MSIRTTLADHFRHPLIWFLIYGAIVVTGVLALRQIAVEVLPQFHFPQISIVVRQPGATAEEMETAVTLPLESQILTLPGVNSVRSSMGSGVVEIDVRFEEGSNTLQDLQLVRSALDQARNNLPTGVDPKAEIMGNAINEVADYGLRFPPSVSTMMAQREVETRIAPALRALPGVQRVDVFGGGHEALWIQPNLTAMQQFGVTISDIAKAVRRQVVLGPDGYLTLGHQDLVIEARLSPVTAQMLGQTLVSGKAGQIPLSTLAHIVHAPVPVHNAVMVDGKPSVMITVFKQPSSSTLPVTRAVSQTLKETITQLPEGSQWIRLYNQGYLVGLIGSDLGRNLVIGGLLAIGVLVWVLGAGRGVWALAVSIPLSLLLAVAGLYWTGHTLNLLTLGALTVAVGLLVDDAIIVFESIYHRWESGMSGWAGVIGGLRDIAAPDISGTLTVVSVFVPLLFVGGLAGLFTVPFGLAMSLALLASLFVSLTLIPIIMGLVKGGGMVQGRGAWLVDRLRAINQRLLQFALARPLASLAACGLLLLVSIGAMVLVSVDFLPLPNEGVLLESFALPPGTSLDQTRRVVDRITQRLQSNPVVAHTYARIGSAGSTFYTEPSSGGEIEIVLKPSVGARNLSEISASLLKTSGTPGVQLGIDTPTLERLGESLSGLPQPFVLRLFGPDIEKLRSLAKQMTSVLRHVPMLSDVFDNDGYPVTQIQLRPRLIALQAVHLSPQGLQDQLSPLLGGEVLAEVPDQDHPLDLYLRLKKVRHLNLAQLGELPVNTPAGWVPLKALANIDFVTRPNLIRHFNGARELDILALPNGPLSTAVAQAKQAFSSVKLPRGYRITFGGLLPQLGHAAIAMLIAATAAFVIVLAILIVQFDGLLVPGLLLLQLPLAFTGGALALAISGVGLNATGLVAFLTLMGISLNHGIVLLHRVRRNQAAGMDKREAVFEAVHVRFRPILLTTLTAVLGMLPTALGWGKGAAPEQGLAIVILGGIVWSALLSANLIPALYVHWSKTR